MSEATYLTHDIPFQHSSFTHLDHQRISWCMAWWQCWFPRPALYKGQWSDRGTVTSPNQLLGDVGSFPHLEEIQQFVYTHNALVQTDKTTVVFYPNKLGGTRSKSLNQLVWGMSHGALIIGFLIEDNPPIYPG